MIKLYEIALILSVVKKNRVMNESYNRNIEPISLYGNFTRDDNTVKKEIS